MKEELAPDGTVGYNTHATRKKLAGKRLCPVDDRHPSPRVAVTAFTRSTYSRHTGRDTARSGDTHPIPCYSLTVRSGNPLTTHAHSGAGEGGPPRPGGQVFVSGATPEGMSRRGLLVVALAGLVVLAGCGGLGGALPEADGPTATAPTDIDTDTEGQLRVHYINVGQSTSILIEGPDGETMLIDTGDFRDDGETVLTYLQRQGVTRIDHLVSSHNDADHIGGHEAVITYFEEEADGVGTVHDPGLAANTQTYSEYLDAVETYGVTLRETRAGDTVAFGGDSVAVDVLGPPDPYVAGEARNENSIVLKLTFGTTSYLLTGDAEDDGEEALLEAYGDRLAATVLKIGHHGSDSSTIPAFLDAVDPEVAVVSSAYDSQFGHPEEVVLERLATRSIPTYWTATHGTVVVTSDGEGVTVRTQAAAPTEATAIREADAVPTDDDRPVSVRARYGGGSVTTLTPTATAGPTTTDGGTAPGAVSLELAAVTADPAGDDRENLADETITLENTGSEAVDLSGYTVADAAGATYTIPEGTVLEPGAQVTIHTGSGTDTETDLYWDRGQPVWNNGGDTVIVSTPGGEVVLEASYE